MKRIDKFTWENTRFNQRDTDAMMASDKAKEENIRFNKRNF